MQLLWWSYFSLVPSIEFISFSPLLFSRSSWKQWYSSCLALFRCSKRGWMGVSFDKSIIWYLSRCQQTAGINTTNLLHSHGFNLLLDSSSVKMICRPLISVCYEASAYRLWELSCRYATNDNSMFIGAAWESAKYSLVFENYMCDCRFLVIFEA